MTRFKRFQSVLLTAACVLLSATAVRSVTSQVPFVNLQQKPDDCSPRSEIVSVLTNPGQVEIGVMNPTSAAVEEAVIVAFEADLQARTIAIPFRLGAGRRVTFTLQFRQPFLISSIDPCAKPPTTIVESEDPVLCVWSTPQ